MSSHCTPGTSTETENNDSSNVLPFDASLSTNTVFEFKYLLKCYWKFLQSAYSGMVT